MLGSSLASVEIVQTAQKMGYFTIVTDNLSPEASPAKKVADEYWMISTDDLDLLEERCKEASVDAVFAGISEFNLDRVKELAGRLGLPCYIEDVSWKYARDKSAFKEKCRETGIPVVEEYSLSDPPRCEEMAGIDFPVVVKPIDGSGNKGLSICFNEEELVQGCEKARSASASRKILVERYIQGNETWNYYYLAESEVRHVYSGRTFRQPGYPSFLYSFGTTAVDDTSEYKSRINDKCIDFLRSIGCSKGIAWFQFIRDDQGNYYALEMAQRMSADTSGIALKRVVGVNAIEWMLDTVFGIEHTAAMLPKELEPPYKGATCVYYHFADRSGTIRSMRGYKELDPEEYQVSILANEGMQVLQYQLLTRIVFDAVNGSDMCDKLRSINACTRILDENGENLYIPFTDYNTVETSHRGLFVHE